MYQNGLFRQLQQYYEYGYALNLFEQESSETYFLHFNAIEKGANPARIFGNNGIPYDSPFNRAVYFKSWKTLDMLLTDFKDQIKPIINDRYREDMYTAAHLLFKVDYGPVYQYSVNTENIKLVEHFIPLFCSAGAEFDIPDKFGITVKKILTGYNLEGL